MTGQDQGNSPTEPTVATKERQSKKSSAAGSPKTQKLNKKIKVLEEKHADLSDKYLRLAAEYDNFRKMAARDSDNRVKTAQDNILVDFLGIMDDMDRTLAVVTEHDKSDPVVEGVKMIHAHMKKFLETRGIEAINAVGQEFDVDLHEALMIVEDEAYPSNVVVEDHQKGYKLNGRVIRHAKVAVNK